jgi:hypothetical protein
MNGYRAANSRRIAGVESVEPSSTMTQSAGGDVWATMAWRVRRA